jgi:hypothetical protein
MVLATHATLGRRFEPFSNPLKQWRNSQMTQPLLPRVRNSVAILGETSSQEIYEVTEVNHNFAPQPATKSQMRFLSM